MEPKGPCSMPRSKLLELGVKLDRLESLLHNPPSKPILTDEDLEFRWKMLSDIQLRTKALALSVYALPLTNRSGDLQAAATEETNRVANSCCQDQMKASLSKDDLELQKPLLSDDATQSHPQVQIKQPGYSVKMSLLWKACWIIFVLMGVAILLSVLVVLCAVI